VERGDTIIGAHLLYPRFDDILFSALTLKTLTDTGNVAEYNRICLFVGKWEIISSKRFLKSIDSSLSAYKTKTNPTKLTHIALLH